MVVYTANYEAGKNLPIDFQCHLMFGLETELEMLFGPYVSFFFLRSASSGHQKSKLLRRHVVSNQFLQHLNESMSLGLKLLGGRLMVEGRVDR